MAFDLPESRQRARYMPGTQTTLNGANTFQTFPQPPAWMDLQALGCLTGDTIWNKGRQTVPVEG